VRAQAAATPATPAPSRGADKKTLGACVAATVLIWFLPVPAGLSPQAWHLFAIFVGTIGGIVTTPLPLGAVAMLGLAASTLTRTLTFKEAFAAFSSEIPWLIALAFFLAEGFIKTGLGNRVAYLIVRAFGKTTLGLTYSLVAAEALLAPAIPSVAARAGGIFMPLAKALCLACGSDPEKGTERKLGAYIMQTAFQCTTVSSAMFITAMAANPLAVNLAAEVIGETISWGTWAVAAFVPGLVCLLGVPAILYVVYPPEVKETPEAPAQADSELKKLGPMTGDEKIMAGTLAVTVGLWVFGGSIGIGNVAAALAGLTILLVTGIVSWKECLSKNAAWDTFTWFAALIAMAACLSKFGFIAWFSDGVVNGLSSLGLPWQGAVSVLAIIYFYSHYLFASGAAHIGAMYTAFLSVAIGLGAPPLVSAVALGCLSNLMGCLTTYGIGSAPPFFNQGYNTSADWYKNGALLSVFYLAVWLGLGGAWWRFLGLW